MTTTLSPAAEQTLFEETQVFWLNPIFRALVPVSCITVSGVILAVGAKSPSLSGQLFLVLGIVIAMELLLPWVLRVRTLVTDRELTVWFWPVYRKRVPIEAIESAEAIRYEPLRDAGGWGLRKSRKFGLVFNVAGDRGVHVVTADGALLIGSQRTDALADAISMARRR